MLNIIALIPVINSGKLDVQLYQYRFQLDHTLTHTHCDIERDSNHPLHLQTSFVTLKRGEQKEGGGGGG